MVPKIYRTEPRKIYQTLPNQKNLPNQTFFNFFQNSIEKNKFEKKNFFQKFTEPNLGLKNLPNRAKLKVSKIY